MTCWSDDGAGCSLALPREGLSPERIAARNLLLVPRHPGFGGRLGGESGDHCRVALGYRHLDPKTPVLPVNQLIGGTRVGMLFLVHLERRHGLRGFASSSRLGSGKRLCLLVACLLRQPQ